METESIITLVKPTIGPTKAFEYFNVYYSYYVDGQAFQSVLLEQYLLISPMPKEGLQKSIYYDPYDPEIIKSEDTINYLKLTRNILFGVIVLAIFTIILNILGI